MKFDMMTILIGVLLFTSLIGVILTNVSTAQNNATGATATLIGLIGLFIVIGFIKVISKVGGK